MSTLDELLTFDDPAAGDGARIDAGNPLFPNYRWLFRIAVPITEPSAARWGTAEWDTAEWSGGAGVWGLSVWGTDAWSAGFEWLDLSDRVRGCSWARGTNTLIGRPEVGELTVELANDDGYLSPANAASTFPSRRYLAPGTLVQAGWWDAVAPGTYIPAFSGELVALEDVPTELDSDPHVTWTAQETLGRLSDVDRPETIPNIGAEPWDARMRRLLADAGWPYGVAATTYATPPMVAAGHTNVQGTGMAGNRLAELYLLADSLGCDLITSRGGRAGLIPKDPTALVGTGGGVLFALSEEEAGTLMAPTAVPWVEPPKVLTNRDDLINRWSIAKAGGAEATVQHDASIAVNGERSSQRHDLIHSDEAWSAELAAYLLAVTGPVLRARKLSNLKVDAAMHPWMVPAVIAGLEINVAVVVLRTFPRGDQQPVTWVVRVRGYTVSLAALDDELAAITAELAVTVTAETPDF